MQIPPAKPPSTSFKWLSMAHLGLAAALLLKLLSSYGSTPRPGYLLCCGLVALFAIAQVIALRRFDADGDPQVPTWILVWVLFAGVLTLPLFIRNSALICCYFLAAAPLFFAATNQLRKLPTLLFLTLVMAATTILLDLVLPLERSFGGEDVEEIQSLIASGLGLYTIAVAGVLYYQHRRPGGESGLRVNVATQYALVITGISAAVIILVTGVLTSQIRRSQIDQVGKNFQTIAENFAKLVGSNLEQQTQKLQLLSEQIPIFREVLVQANAQYNGDRAAARELLSSISRLWEGPQQDADFIMGYLNNPINHTLSRFRGHNSFHKDIVVVDAYGGLVASLGKKPEKLYFFDQKWWQLTWNGGLGNIFIGDPLSDRPDKVPTLRIAVDIVDHTTNEVIGMLSSIYLMGTLLEDIVRFKPDTVDQISMIDADGRVIASTDPELVGTPAWSRLSAMLMARGEAKADAGWVLGQDPFDEAALIGYSSLSTVYNVISDPLHRLRWHIVVSGTRSSALFGVTQSTKLAMLLGLVAIALGILGAIAAARVITQPIEDLTSTASAMSEGQLNKRAALNGPEELVTLSSGFNRLTDRLRMVINNLQAQKKELVAAKREAETATRLKGQFLANMSHEIRTPLNAILGFADLLAAAITDKELRNHAQIIRSSGNDLLHLINDILDLSKIEAGRMEIQRQAVDLRRLFDELSGIFSITAKEKRLHFEIQVTPEVPERLMLDRARMRQILFNLIGNAFKFTDRGEVGCRASAVAGEEPHSWDLVIEVYDTGIGIDPAAYRSIFESFNQHHGEASQVIEGTGLGLPISKSLVEMMAGTISVSGATGTGTVFTIRIPKVAEANAPDTALCPEKTADEGGKKISFQPATLLVADDLAVNRDLIREALKKTPLNIEEVENGQQAVTAARKRAFDLILMDLRMPGMNGYEALEQIRRHQAIPHTPIIAITAAGMKEDVIEIQAAGFDDYLIRPFDQQAFLTLLATFLPLAQGEPAHGETEADVPMARIDVDHLSPWACPQPAHAHLLGDLKRQWKQAKRKQSIPTIVAFARGVTGVGERYGVQILARYGNELAAHAGAFDINQMEKLLGDYEKLLELCTLPDA